MADSSAERDRLLLRSLYFNRTGILLLSMVLLSITAILAAQRARGGAQGVWLGLGVAVLAASLYSFFQVLLTTRQFEGFITDTVRQVITKEITAVTAAALAEYQKLQSAYVPTAVYPAVHSPGRTFNRDLNEALGDSGRYTFYGLTARYAVARLALLPGLLPAELRFVIADPTLDGVVDLRARREAVRGGDESFDRARDDLLRGIYVSFAGMYLTRHRFDRVEICITASPPVDRAELCDDAVFVSLFSDAAEASAPFPSTMQFDRGSVIYRMFDQECNRLFAAHSSKRIAVASGVTEPEFLAALAGVGIGIAAADWVLLKQEFARFREANRGDLVP